jgi:hypothetical protein
MFAETTDEQYRKVGQRHRIAYLLTCGILCGNLLDTIEKAEEQSKSSADARKGV